MSQVVTDKDFVTKKQMNGLSFDRLLGNLVWALSYASTDLRTIIRRIR